MTVRRSPVGWAALLWLVGGCGLPEYAAYSSGRGLPARAPDPGRVVLRRLNQTEYLNTVRDLFATAPPANVREVLPVDPVAATGFDNTAAELSLSPLHLEFYERAADRIVANLTLDDLDPEGHLDCAPSDADQCAFDFVDARLTHAWRRPPDPVVASRYSLLYQQALADEGSSQAAARRTVKAILMSPRFLFRMEGEPDSGESTRALDHYEMATRLAYFLWSSTPDLPLLEAAANEQLGTIKGIQQQTLRMLDDPRSIAMVENFGGQWLLIRALDDVAPSPDIFPDWSEALRSSMKEEMIRFVDDFIVNDRPMYELFTASEGPVDQRMADFYGMSGVAGGDTWQTVALPPERHAGVLTKAGLLTVLSSETASAPVRRGKWVMGALLCEKPPPAPPEAMQAVEAIDRSLPKREQLAQHRADPSCASCHYVMDELGFSLEHFDGIGRWRTVDEGGHTVDPAGGAPGVGAWDDHLGMADAVVASPKLARCIVQNAMTYALGRALRPQDLPIVDVVTTQFEASDMRFSALTSAITTSDAFRYRSGVAP